MYITYTHDLLSFRKKWSEGCIRVVSHVKLCKYIISSPKMVDKHIQITKQIP